VVLLHIMFYFSSYIAFPYIDTVLLVVIMCSITTRGIIAPTLTLKILIARRFTAMKWPTL